MAEWAEWQQVVNVTVEFVNRQGIYRGVAKQLRTELRPHREYSSSRCLAEELLAFVAKQARRARPGERFPGSTEVLESCFGRFKQIEKQQARGGFTSLVLGFGALLAETDNAGDRARNASKPHQSGHRSGVPSNLGTTLFSRRRQAFAGAQQKCGENSLYYFHQPALGVAGGVQPRRLAHRHREWGRDGEGLGTDGDQGSFPQGAHQSGCVFVLFFLGGGGGASLGCVLLVAADLRPRCPVWSTGSSPAARRPALPARSRPSSRRCLHPKGLLARPACNAGAASPPREIPRGTRGRNRRSRNSR